MPLPGPKDPILVARTARRKLVQYAGGSQTITVPPKTPVTEIKATSKTLAAGAQVVILAKRGADGSLTANKGLLAGKIGDKRVVESKTAPRLRRRELS